MKEKPNIIHLGGENRLPEVRDILNK